MQVVAKFEKVSKQQFINDFQDSFTNYDIEEIEKIYDNLKLPKELRLALLVMIFIHLLILL